MYGTLFPAVEPRAHEECVCGVPSALQECSVVEDVEPSALSHTAGGGGGGYERLGGLFGITPQTSIPGNTPNTVRAVHTQRRVQERSQQLYL